MKKVLIASIFATIMLLVPMTSAVFINSDVNDELIDDSEIKPLDNNTEIITFFTGSCHDYNFMGLIGKAKIWVDEDSKLTISGIKKPNSGPLDIFFIANPKEVNASLFIGFFVDQSVDFAYVYGIALGNIEWE